MDSGRCCLSSDFRNQHLHASAGTRKAERPAGGNQVEQKDKSSIQFGHDHSRNLDVATVEIKEIKRKDRNGSVAL